MRVVFERHNTVRKKKKNATVIFLLPMPAAAIFSMAKSSSAERTTLDVNLLVNIKVLRHNDAVVHGVGVCVDVRWCA